MTEVQFAQCGDQRIAFRAFGAGPALILCHGGEADQRNFDNIVPALAQCFRVVTYDQRDTGLTQNTPSAYTMADLGRDVGAIAEFITNEPVFVFGASFGGMVALNFALERPAQVRRLAVSATISAFSPNAADPAFIRLAMESRENEAAKQKFHRCFFSPSSLSDDPAEASRRLAPVLVKRTPEAEVRRMQAAQSHNVAERLARITAPTLVIAGEDDHIIPPALTQSIAKGIPGAQFLMLMKTGHVSSLEAPDSLVRALTAFFQA